MSTYARVDSSIVVEIITPPSGISISQQFTAAFIADLVDVTSVSPQPEVGWIYNNTKFTAPTSPLPPSLAQQAQAALYAGLTISLSGTLSATLFPTDGDAQQKIAAVVTTLTATGDFPGGAISYPMKDSSGEWHIFTAAQYKMVASAIAGYVAALQLIVDGNPLNVAGLPVSAVAISLE